MKSPILLLTLFLALCSAACSDGVFKEECPDGQMVHGECIPRDCPEQQCPEGFACIDNACVDPDCIGVECAPGSSCAGGNCYPGDCLWRNCPGLGEVCIEEECEPVSCVGVNCPGGQSCAAGRCYPDDCQTHTCPGYGEVCIMEECIERTCVDLDCPSGQACAGGFCYPMDCEDTGCFGSGEVCVDGQCVSNSCVDVVCGENMTCANGFCYPVDCSPDNLCSDFGEVCVDDVCTPADCVGVECPIGQHCAHGECFASDCSAMECRENEVCYDGRCQREICVGVSCPPGQHCADGECVLADCGLGAGLDCAVWEMCQDGSCVPNDCAHVNCPPSQSCAADGNCYPEDCLGTSCGTFELCLNDECVDQMCVDVICPDGLVCSGGQCYHENCGTATCLPGELCIEDQCQDEECGGCRCCPTEQCTLNNQCAVAQCCGVEHICLFNQELGAPMWSEGGSSCSDQDPCTADQCLDGVCVGQAMVCDDPPPDFCDGNTRHAFPPQGVCNAGGCQYSELTEECAYQCSDGLCVGEPCGSINCDPGEQCVNDACSCSGTGPDCHEPQSCCQGACVDILTNNDNCGFCGFSCGGDAACQDGFCSCSAGLGNCNGDWSDGCEEDTQTSLIHCGGCGQPCPVGLNADVLCQSGSCDYSCHDAYSDCDSDQRTCESDLTVDDNNCGFCGNACGQHAHCENSLCVCDSGWLNCNDTFSDGCEVDGRSDDNHCGQCFESCLGGSNSVGQCVNGDCAYTCVDPWIDCDSDPRLCEVDSARDVLNCGGCGNQCGDWAECIAASCSCYDGAGNCDDDWSNGCEVDITTSLAHCGDCDDPCSPAHASGVCQNSDCRVDQCDTNYGNCDSQDTNGCEINLLNDPDNCAACGFDCGQNSACSVGNCGCISGWGDCANGISDGCEQALNTVQHCGACSDACSPNNASGDCSSGDCQVASCSNDYFDANGLVGDGCECYEDVDEAEACSGATSMGTVTDVVGQGQTAVMVNIPGVRNDVDCFRVTLSASNACNFSFSHTGGASLVFTGYGAGTADHTAGCSSAYCESGSNTSFSMDCTGNCGTNGTMSGDFTICVRAANPNAPLCLDYSVSASCN